MEVSGQFHARVALPQEKVPVTHWTGSWVGPRTSLDAVVKRKIPSPYRELNASHPARSLATTSELVPVVKPITT